MMRDRTPEQLVRNRQKINLTWQEILNPWRETLTEKNP
jgi:hypothetical protein